MTGEQYEKAQQIQEEITELTELLEGGLQSLSYNDHGKVSGIYPTKDLQEDLTRVIQDRVNYLKVCFDEL